MGIVYSDQTADRQPLLDCWVGELLPKWPKIYFWLNLSLLANHYVSIYLGFAQLDTAKINTYICVYIYIHYIVYTWINTVTRLVFGLVRFSEIVFEDQGRCQLANCSEKKYRAPTTNMAPLKKIGLPKRVGKVHHFSGANLLFVLGSVDFSIIFHPWISRIQISFPHVGCSNHGR